MKKVLFVGGWGRSGSTIVSNLLGSVLGFASLGEVRYLWDRGLQLRGLCGCGTPIVDCAFWTRVLESASTLHGAIAPERMVGTVGSGAIKKQVLSQLLLSIRHGRGSGVNTTEATLAALYAAAFEVSGARVLVDSSKVAPYATVLNRFPEFELYYLHLVRDPRAVAFSWRRKKHSEDLQSSSLFPRYSSFRSAAEWSFFNFLGNQLGGRLGNRYLRVRYEDFVLDPRAAIAKILSFVGEPGVAPDWLGSNEVRISQQHAVSGNPARFCTGVIRVVGDDEWKRAMHRWEQILVMSVTAPISRSYGYRFSSTV